MELMNSMNQIPPDRQGGQPSGSATTPQQDSSSRLASRTPQSKSPSSPTLPDPFTSTKNPSPRGRYDPTITTTSPIPTIRSPAVSKPLPPSPAPLSSSPPQIRIDTDSLREGEEKDRSERQQPPKTSKSKPSSPSPSSDAFKGIALDVPSGQLSDELAADKIHFSNRGSMLIDGKKVNGTSAATARYGTTSASKPETIAEGGDVRPEPRSKPETRATTGNVNARLAGKVLSMEEESLSAKVRSLYIAGGDYGDDHVASPQLAGRMNLRWQDAIGTEQASGTTHSAATSTTDIPTEISNEQNGNSRPASMMAKGDYELAGGLEDWEDVQYDDVDRYGFIVPRPAPNSGNTPSRSSSLRDPQHLQRVTSSLRLAAETPRRKNTVRKPPHSSHGETMGRQAETSPVSGSNRPQSAQSSVGRHSTFRAASNKLPHNKGRKVKDEAADMMTLPLNPVAIPDEPAARRKEIEREEKWMKMARPVASKKVGGGMTFEFDTSNPKLIERTWKGIPDRWRASAWHAFLSASARRRKGCLSDDQLTDAFEKYQDQSSPDDVQIDIDVPRTINSHIMFRRRYRGGQRLLFRVLHAMSIHFSDTGYVQGMAALAATLLSYYEEEKAFIMLVRLWELRGLDELYKAGFGGLMTALDDFEKQWLGRGDLGGKLTDLGIGPTAYGTKWYLTLFNYSIPFPAQLRVWDVFMLLGDDVSRSTAVSSSNNGAMNKMTKVQFGTTLDVLHATSAALIDGMREILLASDFENAMKVLTSWIPIQDEDLFMRVAKVEWKMHRKRGRPDP